MMNTSGSNKRTVNYLLGKFLNIQFFSESSLVVETKSVSEAIELRKTQIIHNNRSSYSRVLQTLHFRYLSLWWRACPRGELCIVFVHFSCTTSQVRAQATHPLTITSNIILPLLHVCQDILIEELHGVYSAVLYKI